MSIPINHHYVSQCQIRNFFNHSEEKIYLYDKILKKPFERKSTKRVFSEDESNTRITNEQIDHLSLEKDLKDNFEDDFTKHFEVISKITSNPKYVTPNLRDAIIWLTKYGIAGEIRIPAKKKESDDVIKDFLFNKLLPSAALEFKNELEELKTQIGKTKYTNTVQYSEFANQVFKSMGGINWILYVIKCDHYFLLPDRPSIAKREKINEYFNPDIKEIAMVGIPLSSKIFLHSESKKLRKFNDKIIELAEQDVSIIEKINHSLYINAQKQVACESKKYLANFIKNLETL